jgi:hypothetical protein
MSLAALPQELRDKILEFCLCSERQFEIGNRDKDGVQSVYYSCVPLLQLRTTNKQLWAEASLAWARRHFARLLVSARPSAECTINLAPPSHWVSSSTTSIQVIFRITPYQHTWEKSTSVCLKDVLDAILAWSLGDMLGLHRFTRVDLRISLSHWMHTKDVLDSLTRSMESYTATDWKLPQVIPLDRWEAKGRVTVCFEQSNDTFSHISGTISVLVPRARK